MRAEFLRMHRDDLPVGLGFRASLESRHWVHFTASYRTRSGHFARPHDALPLFSLLPRNLDPWQAVSKVKSSRFPMKVI
jgi:hypothetical protein